MIRSRPAIWPWILVSLGLLMMIGFIGLSLIASAVGGTSIAGPNVGLVELSGAITDQGVSGLLGGRSGGARAFMEDLERAEKDDNVKAVVIRVNSPGGSASASQEMYEAVLRLRKKKPVICSMGDVAASGGYYVAAACNKIYANPSTITGSIGVISQFLNYQQLFRKVGLDETTIKSGKFKDAGNPARPLTAEEKQLFQAMIMNVYGQFVNDVAIGRGKATNGKMTKARILKLANGSVYTGLQAKANLLVDKIGGLHEAVEEAGKMGGIEGVPIVKEVGRKSGGLGGLLGANASDDLNRSVSQVAGVAGDAFAHGFISRVQQELKAGSSGREGLQAR